MEKKIKKIDDNEEVKWKQTKFDPCYIFAFDKSLKNIPYNITRKLVGLILTISREVKKDTITFGPQEKVCQFFSFIFFYSSM